MDLATAIREETKSEDLIPAEKFAEEILKTGKTLSTLLIDFEYTENEDGTVTITDWKRTLNGVPSTEIIIPDDSRIRL